MITLPNIDDDEDELPSDFEREQGTESVRPTSAAAIGRLSLEAALDRAGRAALKHQPCLSIVRVPDAIWADIIEDAVKRMDRAPIVNVVTERRKIGGAMQRAGIDELKWVQSGRSLLFVSPDPDELLAEAVLAAADVMIEIPPLTPQLLRKAIRLATGGVARGVTDEMAALDLAVICAVVRPDLTARQCVDNLRRAFSQRPPPQVPNGPLLSDLPLTADIRAWSGQTLADLNGVKSGSLTPDRLVYGVLEGPPGTGKTLIVEALARSAGWNLVGSSVGSWFTVGDGALGGVARNVRSFVDQVLVSEPAIGFLDELDALPDRASLEQKGRDWWLPVITLFLTEIDRVRKSGRKVLLLGATNYYERLDAALIRPGRLHRRVPVLAPEAEADILALLHYFLGGEFVDADLIRLVRFARGATPAMVEGWAKEARSTARQKNRPLKVADVLDQMVPKDIRTPADIRTAALHEVGHAIVAHRVGHEVRSVSILPDGMTGGVTETRLPSLMPTWAQVRDIVTISLGGRAADIILGTGAHGGAEGDLETATRLLRTALERQGLGDTLAHMPEVGRRPATVPDLIEDLLQCLLQRAIGMVEADRDVALMLAERLIDEKVVSGDEVAKVLERAAQASTCRPQQPDAAGEFVPGADLAETAAGLPCK